MRFGERERGDFLACDAREIFFLLLLRPEKQQRLRNADRLMRGHQRGQVRIPTSEQHRGAAIINLRQTRGRRIASGSSRQTRPSRRGRRCFSAESHRCDRSRPRRHSSCRYFFKLREKFSSPAARSSALCSGHGIDAIEIVATDEQVAGEATALVERIARAFGKIQRRSFTGRHLGSVDHGRRGAGLALVSSAICFSGASSGEFIFLRGDVWLNASLITIRM